jgi:hypothetical protein
VVSARIGDHAGKRGSKAAGYKVDLNLATAGASKVCRIPEAITASTSWNVAASYSAISEPREWPTRSTPSVRDAVDGTGAQALTWWRESAFDAMGASA